jgi:bifunctional DNA-binding transcriptional regulator/antitoxin component of YhaV-PrlF toxin-antitoxin module
MMESALTSKGQATIPKAVREHLRLKPWRSAQILHASRRQRDSLAEATRLYLARDR